MRIVALDPGGETGYAILHWTVKHGGSLGTYGHLGPENHHHKLRTLLEQNARVMPLGETAQRDMIVVCERFDPRENNFAKLVSCEYIGVAREWCQYRSVTLVLQGSSIKPGVKDRGTAWATDRKLEALGLLLTPASKWKHANDALRHLAYFICHNGHVPAELRDIFFQKLKALNE